MRFWLKNKGALMLPLALTACLGKQQGTGLHKVTVSLAADSTAIRIGGLDHGLIADLTADSAAATTWQALAPVFREATDSDLRGLEPVYPGKYSTAGDVVIFTPDTAFKKGNTYRAELNIPDPVTKEEVMGRDTPPGETKVQAFRFVFK